MRALIVATLFAVLAVAGLQLRSLCREASAPVAVARTQPEPPRAIPAAPRVDVRPEITAKIEQDRPRTTTVADLDRYLDDLEAAARRKHQVTALEVEPGLQAIRELQAQLGPDATVRRQQDFAQRMATLSAQLDGRDLNPPAPVGIAYPSAS